MLIINPYRFAGAAAFTPADLFAASEAGAWYDPSDLSTLWKDTAGTDPVTADGDAVARMDDKSGNGNNVTQATAAERPLYKTSGGVHWLYFDGVDDYMDETAIRTSDPWSRLSASRQVVRVSNDRVFSDRDGGQVAGLLQGSGASDILMASVATTLVNSNLTYGADAVISEQFATTSSSLTIDNGTAATGTLDTSGHLKGLRIGVRRGTGTGNHAEFRLHGLIIRDDPIEGEDLTNTRSFLADLQGRTL